MLLLSLGAAAAPMHCKRSAPPDPPPAETVALDPQPHDHRAEHEGPASEQGPELPAVKVSGRRLVVAWKGAVRAPSSVTRTKDEARARADELAARARKDPAQFEALIAAESDGWDRSRGGDLGTFTLGSGRQSPEIERAIFALAEGSISTPVESLFGYEILKRLSPVDKPRTLAGAHILITFRGAERAATFITRSKEEALTEAQRILGEARADPSRFGLIAVERSDDGSRTSGGDLGAFRVGTLPSAIEETLSALKPGEVGGPVLSPFGYHILLRREAPAERPYVPQ